MGKRDFRVIRCGRISYLALLRDKKFGKREISSSSATEYGMSRKCHPDNGYRIGVIYSNEVDVLLIEASMVLWHTTAIAVYWFVYYVNKCVM